MSYKNNQPLQVLNQYDETTGEMVTDPTNPISDKYGDRREVREGRGFNGDGIAYYTHTNILAQWFEKIWKTLDDFEIKFDIIGGDSGNNVDIITTNVAVSTHNGLRVNYIDSSNYGFGTMQINFYTGSATLYRFYASGVDLNNTQKYSIGIKSVNNEIFFTIDGTQVTTVKLDGDRVLVGGDQNAIFGIGGTAGSANNLRRALLNFYINDGVDEAYWSFEEESGNITLPSYYSGDNFTQTDMAILTLMNGGSVNHGVNNEGLSFANIYGYTVADGSNMFAKKNGTSLLDNGVIIPQDQANPTKCQAYDSLGNQIDLQYKGENPYPAKVVQSGCFVGGNSAYMTITGLLTTDVITAFGSSSIPTCTVDGRLDFVDAEKYYGVTITRGGVEWAFLPMTNHEGDGVTVYDCSVGNSNHATIFNPSSANYGLQDEFHYLQDKGFVINNNILKYTEDLGGSDWENRNSVIITTNTDISPKGTLTADKIEQQTAGAFRHVVQEFTSETGITYTASIFLKKTEADNWSGFIQTIIDGGVVAGVIVNSKNGNIREIESVNNTSSNVTPLVGFGIIDYSTNWWRIYIKRVFYTSTLCTLGVLPAVSDSDTSSDLSSSHIGSGVFWGAQLNKGENLQPYRKNTINNVGVRIPAKYNTETDCLDNPLTHVQNGYRFLDSGSKLRYPKAPALIQADENNILFDISGEPIDQEFDDFTTNNLSNNQHFNDVSSTNHIEQMRYHKPDNFASQQQINTEKKLTNN